MVMFPSSLARFLVGDSSGAGLVRSASRLVGGNSASGSSSLRKAEPGSFPGANWKGRLRGW